MKPEIITLAETLKGFGFVVYLAENQNYGIFTDSTGKRVVYFQYDRMEGYQFSGTYKANRECGTGWGLNVANIDRPTLKNALINHAPYWATKGYTVNYHNIDTYLKDNAHSNYYLF
jgi:hypothetical protein